MIERVPLQLTEEQMRALGYRIVDQLVNHFNTLPQQRPTQRASRAEMEALLREPIPQEGRDPLDVLKQVEQDVFGHIMLPNHPRFFAFVPSPSNFVSVMADALASGYNTFAGTWLEAAGPAQVELVTLDWLRTACGLPDTSGGVFTSGGSVANLTAIATARHVKLQGAMSKAVGYCSDQTHSSVGRAFRILGFQEDQLRKLSSDKHFRLDPKSLHHAIQEDKDKGLNPFCVVGSAGTTNTGAIDPLPEIAELCQRENLWFHVDGAYGAAALLCDQGKHLLRGLDLADSIAIDPHKWLFQPYELGCLLVRDRQHLYDAFHIFAEYLEDAKGTDEEVNFADYSIQLTRRFRALKLWMSLQVFGVKSFSRAIQQGFERAEQAEERLQAMSGWRIITTAQMGILTFRAEPNGYNEEAINQHNKALVEDILNDGVAMIISTALRNKIVLRMCTINPRTTEDDIRDTLKRLDALSQRLTQKERKR